MEHMPLQEFKDRQEKIAKLGEVLHKWNCLHCKVDTQNPSMFDRHQKRYTLDYRDLYAYTPQDHFRNLREEFIDDETTVVLGHDDLVSASYLSADGQHLVTGGYDKIVRFWKIAPGKNASCIQEVPDLRGHKGWVNAVVLTEDGQMILSGGYDKEIKIWSAKTGEHMRNLSGHRGAITCLCLIKDDAVLCSGGLDGEVIIWDLVEHDRLWTININQPVTCMLVNGSQANEQTKLFVGSWRKDITIWDLRPEYGYEEMKEECLGRNWYKEINERQEVEWINEGGLTKDAHTHGVTCLAISAPYFHTLLSGSHDQTVKLWRIELRNVGDEAMKKLVHTFDDLGAPVERVEFAPSHDYFFAMTEDAKLRMYSVKELQCVYVFEQEFSGRFLSFRFQKTKQEDINADFYFYPYVVHGTRKIFVQQLIETELDLKYNILELVDTPPDAEPVSEQESEQSEEVGNNGEMYIKLKTGVEDEVLPESFDSVEFLDDDGSLTS